MKRITKARTPSALTQWMRNQKGINLTYGDLSGNVKQIVLNSLLKEQGWICCYTGLRINEDGSHIEHLYPQTLCRKEPGQPGLYGAKRDVDYTNLLAAYPAETRKGETGCPYGAVVRKDWYDAQSFVHPLRPDCETQFMYTLDGEIKPADGNPNGPAAMTIEELCLNHGILVQQRKAAIDALLFDDQTPLSKAQLEKINKTIFDRDQNGQFTQFCFVLKQASAELLRKARQEKMRREAIQRQLRSKGRG